MKTLYLDCGMGAAGDMLAAALIELLPDRQDFIDRMNSLGIPGVTVAAEKSVKCGITGTHFHVDIQGEEEDEHLHEHMHKHSSEGEHEHEHADGSHHSHASLHGIEHIVRDHMHLSEDTAKDVLAVYNLIAEAESRVHGIPVSEIHFHEVGTMDAVADITAVCLLMRELSPDEVLVSPVATGSGTVRCAHGILPVPAPATAQLLEGMPVFSGRFESELCTPTGAALLKYFATGFGTMPVMRISCEGYGMGRKDFERVNCVRALVGTRDGGSTDTICDLSCNVDDMTAEEIGFAMERFYDDGALEAFTTPIYMKKNRPGTLIHVFCLEQDRDKMVRLMFRHTSTIGIREDLHRRYVLDRRFSEIETPYGTVRRKDVTGYGAARGKYEYDDISRIAKEQDMPIFEVRKLLK